ncbi:MAG: T9SS type A sorting domain-containing protein [Paludibacteraceae bacterium]
MKKTLLVVCALTLISLSAFSVRTDLSLTNLSGGFGDATYDAGTKTITYTAAWSGGKGWWLGSADYSAYSDVTVNFAATDATVKLVVQYSDDTNNTPDIYTNAGGTTIKVVLDPAKKNNVKQIYLQKGGAGSLTLTEAYLTGVDTIVPSAVINFEDKTVGTTYSIVGWGETAMTATVVANPSGIGNSLHTVGTNWNSYPKFSVKLPDGITISDIEKIKFDIYFNVLDGSTQNSWKKIDYFIGAPGASFTANAPTATTSDNIIKSDSTAIWIAKEFTVSTSLTDAVKALNQFDIAFGMNDSKTDYYLDNISFIAKAATGVLNISESDIFHSRDLLQITRNGNIQLFDINGRLIISKDNVRNIDLSSVSHGVYIARVVVNNKIQVLKFIK